MRQVWGRYHDPDTEQGIEVYRETGLTLYTPEEIRNMDSRKLREMVEACSRLLDSTYGGNYPRHTKEADSLIEGIMKRQVYMFALGRDSHLVATASIMRRQSGTQGVVSFAELSKAAKLPEAESISVRHLSKYRIAWAMQNLTDVNFLYGSPRVAVSGPDGTVGGKQAQSVWWGGRRHGITLPLITTNVGWNFRIGGIEPLTGFTIPLETSRWAQLVSSSIIYLPDENIRAILEDLLSEGTDGVVCPSFAVVNGVSDSRVTFREARTPTLDVVTKYYVTGHGDHLPARTMQEVDGSLAGVISQKVIVESDIAKLPEGANVMRSLMNAGWTFVGWQPSELFFGGICPMFARVNPGEVQNLVQPVHYAEYFSKSGLGRTQEILDCMYRAMYEQACSNR